MLNKGKSLAKLAYCAICCLAAAQAAHAAPPPGSNGSGLLERASGLLGARPTRGPSSRLDLQRLDLRAPDALAAQRAQRAPAAIEDSRTAFPSGKRARTSSDTRVEDDLPALGGGVPMRTMSKAEDMARRVQREGVPIARLWESRSALLHVGLSPRGKPGLWLIQKVP
ncbi:MAG: hypothetical protein ABSG30_18365 [Steroidobacteraceae bacterium]|jgi:hypothetical protein